MKRVIVLNHFAVPRDQPGGTRHVELFSRLEGWDTTIIASRLNPSSGRKQGNAVGFVFVPVVPYKRNGLSRILNWCSYAVTAGVRAMQGRRPDIVYASSPHLLAGLAGWVVARVRRAAFVLEIRDLWPQVLVDMGHLAETSPVYRALKQLERFLYARADRIVTMAPGTTAALVDGGVPAGKIVYLPNGADPRDFETQTDRATLRARYGFTRFTGVYAGAHGPANGLQLLLDAADAIRDVDMDVVLVGDGVQKDQLRALAENRDLPNVRFLDPVPKTEMADVLAAADFGLHVLADVPLFRSAVSPNKVFDYMAASLPVLTNCPGVVGDMVTDAQAGITVGPSSLAEGVRRLANLDVDDLASLGSNGVGWLQDNFTRSSVAKNLETLLNSLILSGGMTS